MQDAQSFGGSLVQTITIGGNSNYDAPLLLEWDQPYGAATSNLEILVFQNGRLVATATNRLVGEPTNPWTGVDLLGGQTYQIAIENLSGPNPGLIKEIVAGNGLPVSLSGANLGTTFGHAITPGAITVGAVSAATTPAFGVSPAIAESFSSSGAGTMLLFDDHGNRLATPDLLSPVDVSGIDDIHTTIAGGLGDFYGTSAATPSVAGIVALMLQANPSLTPDQVDQFLESSALAMPNTAVSGAGLAQASVAIGLTSRGVVLQTDGGTSLTLVANRFYYLLNGSGAGPVLKYAGADVTVGEFGSWHPIGAVQTTAGYDVAWTTGTGQYTIWTTDSNSNYTSSPVAAVSGTNIGLEGFELTFGQDLNGDGVIGIPKIVIQTDATTSLTLVGGTTYYLLNSSGSGPSIKYGSADVTLGEFGSWHPIGAVQTTAGYDVAWTTGTGQYTIWTTDSNGNYNGMPVAAVPGINIGLEGFEPTFGQDLNGDGVIGIPKVVIQTNATTSLTLVGGTTYYLLNSSGSGPSIKYGGPDVTMGEFGSWHPIDAVQTTGGYDIAWTTGTGQYTIWMADSNGNYTSSPVAAVPASSTALESFEPTFGQDINGDGAIGIPKVVIQTDGPTSLTVVGGTTYYLLNSSGSGPSIKYGGADVPWASSAPGIRLAPCRHQAATTSPGPRAPASTRSGPPTAMATTPESQSPLSRERAERCRDSNPPSGRISTGTGPSALSAPHQPHHLRPPQD